MKIGLLKEIYLKNNMKKLLVLFTLSLGVFVSAQSELTEGVVVSKQTMASDNAEMQAQFATIGDMQTTTYFKDNKSRSEVSSPITGDIITIIDKDTNETLVMMDNPMLGKKYMLQKNEISDEQLEGIDIVAGNGTKTILGYECKQYNVSLEKEGVKMEMELYTTESINAVSQQLDMLGGKLKGFPLYMIMKMNQMGNNITITTEVTDINKDVVPDDKFNMTPAAGYEKIQGQ